MFLTETWMGGDTDEVVIGELSPPGYTFINIPRPNDCHGGIGVLHHQSLKLQVYPSTFTAISFEYVIIVDTVNKINFVVTYRPYPSSVNKFTTSQFLTEFDDFLLYVNGLSGKIILLGDYNIQVDNPGGPGVTHFLSSIDEVGLHQHVVGPTHRCGHTLDLFLSRPEENLIKSCTVGPILLDCLITTWFCVSWILVDQRIRRKSSPPGTSGTSVLRNLNVTYKTLYPLKTLSISLMTM